MQHSSEPMSEVHSSEPMSEVDATNTSANANDTQATLFQVDIEVVVKDFMSQKVGAPKAAFQVNVDTLEDFLQCVWSMINSHISRELLFNFETEEYEWAGYELNVDSLGKFVVFLDKTSKRTTEVANVSKKTLQAWTKKKALIVVVHAYGIVLKKKQDYDKAYKQIIQPEGTDRAGAVNNEEVFKCIDQLKILHPDLLATEASWLRWANYIKKQPGHIRENLMIQDPPAGLLELFKLIRAESEHIQEIRSSISIGKRINKSIADALPMIENEVDDLIQLMKNGLRRSEHLKAVIECLKTQLASNNNLMDGFSEATGPQENEFSLELLGDIEYIVDIDHQQL